MNRRSINGAIRHLIWVVALMLFTASAVAAGPDLQTRLENFLHTQTANVNGQVTIKVSMPDTPIGPCGAPQPFLPQRTRHLSGYITVGVKCPGNQPLTRYFRAYISIETTYFVAAHLLKTGDQITLDDLNRITGDITRLAPGVITDAAQLLGMIAARRIAEGIPLTKNMVHVKNAVERGDQVNVLAVGTGFSITTSGKALNNAPVGGQVRVRTIGGATVTGVARDGNTVVIRQ